MKSFLLLSFVVLTHRADGTGSPLLQWDPDTAKDCVEWHNDGEESCEEVRDYFGINPEEFNRWNSSVSLECEPWRYQSYCIVTLEGLNQTAATMTPSTTIAMIPSTSTRTFTLGPSPTSWFAAGCYAENTALPILELNLNPNGDASLTIPKCQDSCYRQAYDFAGVQKGDQCWCSTFVGGEWSEDQEDCNIPCAGDENTMCGGNGFFSVFKAQENDELAFGIGAGDNTATGISESTSTGTQSATTSESSTGAAARNAIIFGKIWW